METGFDSDVTNLPYEGIVEGDEVEVGKCPILN